MKTKKVYFFFIVLCIIQLFYLFHYRSGFKFEIIKEPFGKNSGRLHAVSPEVIESNDMLITNNVVNFSLSKKIKNDTYFYQRFVEFNYPIRIKKDSLYKFFLISEDVLENCVLYKTGKYLKLTKC
tara:strand:+ start:412 stop:786 length:375 start_codon:yes stop_codon:yes gene_type:complete